MRLERKTRHRPVRSSHETPFIAQTAERTPIGPNHAMNMASRQLWMSGQVFQIAMTAGIRRSSIMRRPIRMNRQTCMSCATSLYADHGMMVPVRNPWRRRESDR